MFSVCVCVLAAHLAAHACADAGDGLPPECACVPSPQEYLLGAVAHRAALLAVAVSADDAGTQRVLVADTVQHGPGAAALDRRWRVFCLSWPHRVLALAHALASRVRPQFRLSSEQCAQVRAVVAEKARARMHVLCAILKDTPCAAEAQWLRGVCVKPGAFYTQEHRERRLASGLHHEDLDCDGAFYDVRGECPEYLASALDVVERCCRDVWRDPAVVAGIAELMCCRLEAQSGAAWGRCCWDAPAGPTQASADAICAKMTGLYMDAILRSLDLDALFRAVQRRVCGHCKYTRTLCE